jgi:hypothetical protein
MIDFALTNTGDLIVDQQESFPVFCLQWRDSAFSIFNMSFLQKQEKDKRTPEGIFEFNFDASSATNREKKNTRSIHGLEELKQRLIILFRTEEGACPLNTNLGSKLVIQKHKDINSMPVLQEIQRIVKEKINDLVEDPAVVIKVEKSDSAFFCQNVSIYIYQNNELIFKFEV